MIDLELIENFSIDKSDWVTVKFGDIVYEPKESVKDPIAEGIEHVVGLEHIDSEDIHLRRSASIEESTTFSKRFRKGDVLFGRRRAYLKKAAKAEFDGICSGDITVMRANEELLLPELLPFIVNNDKFFDYAIEYSAGGLSPRVKFKDLAKHEFLLPLIEAQKRILAVLQSMDELLESRLAMKPIVAALVSSIKRDVFEKEYKNYTSLGKCGEWSSGGTPSKNNPAYWDGDIPWVSPKDMKAEFIYNSIDKITQKAVDEKSKLLSENSILIVVRGMILAHSFPVALTKVPVTFNQDMKALVVNECYDPEYVFSFLQYKKDTVLSMTTTTTHGTKRLATDTLFDLKIPILTKDEQAEFLAELSSAKSAYNNLGKSIYDIYMLLHSFVNKVF